MKHLKFRDYFWGFVVLLILVVKDVDIAIDLTLPFGKTEQIDLINDSLVIPASINFPETPVTKHEANERTSTPHTTVPVVAKASVSKPWTPEPYSFSRNKAQYFSYWGHVIKSETESYKEQTGVFIPVSVKLAILALETGYGEHSSDDFNHFNIKWFDNRSYIPKHVYGQAVVGSVKNKRVTTESNEFFKFKTPWLASRFHSYFISAPHYMRHYNSSYARNLKPHERWAYALQRGGYGGNSKTYGEKLLKIINDWDLRKYD